MKSLRIRTAGFAASFFLILAVSPRAHGDVILYGSTGGDNASGGGRIYLIDVTTQMVSLIGDTGFDRIGGIAFNSIGTLYGVSGGSANPGTLLTINTSTGAASVVGAVSDSNLHIDGIRFNSLGALYGTAYDAANGVGSLVTVNPANAAILSFVTMSGSGNSFSPGIAFDALDTLYVSRGNASGRTEDLDVVNPLTGQMMPIGSMTAVLSDIVFTPDGTLYGCSPTGEVYSIDPGTGAKTLLFDTDIANLSGLAAPIPEPSTYFLLIFALLGLFLVGQYQRRRQRA